MANTAGEVSGLNSYTTNAAGVHENTVRNPVQHFSDNYYVDHEGLHQSQDWGHGSENSSIAINTIVQILDSLGIKRMPGEDNKNLPITPIPATPTNNPTHGENVHFIPADSFDTKKTYLGFIPVPNFISEHSGAAASNSLNDIYNPLFNHIINGTKK
ncbi:hypothetical protein PT277_05095 [Acetobacteraceae bacterium ESL0709]|nr:hypothetical protein [Acetobacteraceae bacterium ESL0697]MDF7678071.1 hypothetical protein [Acetobacteraceae bacterium ESL0709]